MSEDWGGIATEVADSLNDIGFDVTIEQPVTGSGGTLADPVPGTPVSHVAKAIEKMIRRRDSEGAVLQVIRALIIGTDVVTPDKGWLATVRGKKHRINEVRPLAPGGVDLLYVLELEG